MTADPFPSYRFYVEIEGSMEAVFTEVSGLQLETDIMEYSEGGNNGFVYRLPGRTKVGNITLKRGMVSTDGFFKWFVDIMNGKVKRRHVTIVVMSTELKEVTRWSFVGAFPVKWTGPSLNASGNTVAIEQLELAHNGMQVDR